MNFKKRINGSWVDTPNYIHNTSTDTITTLPAVVYANGTTATVGLKGQTVQSSIPSPTSPIMPQGTGERTGNLFDEIYPDLEQGQVVKYKPIFVGDGGFTLSTDYPLVQAGTADLFLLSGNVSSGASTVSNGVYFGQSRTFSSVGGYVTIGYRKYSATHPLLSDYHTMLNLGSTPLPYEPYGYKIPISSASTTTPVYLGEVQTTRKIRKLVFNGTEPWVLSGNIVYINNTDTMKLSPLICTHFPNVQNTGMWNGNNWIFQVDISNLGMSGLDAWFSYLQQQYAAGTPVTVWYVLATEETAVVNEPLMKIGDYADEVSNISIPVTAGGDTISVGTTVQPSEVTANYHGWHNGAVKGYENGDWQPQVQALSLSNAPMLSNSLMAFPDMSEPEIEPETTE